MYFADADAPDTMDVYGKLVTIDELLNDEDANRIVEFVNKYKDCYIIVHCDAGASRSAGVAAAILNIIPATMASFLTILVICRICGATEKC